MWMKPSKNCAIPVDGQYAYVAPPQERADLEAYIAEVRRIDSAEGFRGASGVYTWILYRTADDPTIKFAAALVRSVIELGTLHHALARGTGAVTIHGAGELKKRDPAKHEILINFQSGSFMEKWALPETCTLGEMERFLLAKIRPILKGLKVDTPRKSSFITDEMTPPTMEELQLYASKGFKVCLYADRESCWKGKGTCENPLSIEPMKAASRHRKTRKTKTRARKTRRRLRGGVKEDKNPDWEELDKTSRPVKDAEALVGPKNPPPLGPLRAALADMKRRGQPLPPALEAYLNTTS